MNHHLLKEILPPFLIRRLHGIRYGWHGNYKSWEDAKSRCTGYDSEIIIDKVKESLLKVKNGEAAYERDSVLFDEIQYSFPVLSSLMWIAALNKGTLNLLDFGGSLGSTYFQNKKFLDKLDKVNWCIVEQPSFVDKGKTGFEDEHLHFYRNIEDCLVNHKTDAVLFSSVLQYLEDPFAILEEVNNAGIKYVIIDRTPFIKGSNRITVQKVPSKIYKASYPCWFFNREDFLEKISGIYTMIMEFDSLDKANIQSDFKGFLFVRNE